MTVTRGETDEAEHLMLPARRSLPPPVTALAPAATPSEDGSERVRIAAALAKTSGNPKEAAAMLGISRRTIVNKIERYGLGRPRRKTEP